MSNCFMGPKKPGSGCWVLGKIPRIKFQAFKYIYDALISVRKSICAGKTSWLPLVTIAGI